MAISRCPTAIRRCPVMRMWSILAATIKARCRPTRSAMRRVDGAAGGLRAADAAVSAAGLRSHADAADAADAAAGSDRGAAGPSSAARPAPGSAARFAVPAQREMAANFLAGCDWRANPQVAEALLHGAKQDRPDGAGRLHRQPDADERRRRRLSPRAGGDADRRRPARSARRSRGR